MTHPPSDTQRRGPWRSPRATPGGTGCVLLTLRLRQGVSHEFDPIQPLKITLILLIVSEGFWLLSRLLSVVGLEIYSLLPSALYNLIGMLSNVLMIVLFVLLIRLISRLQLKP